MTNTTPITLLRDEPAHPIIPSIAKCVGLIESIIIQHIHYMSQKTDKNGNLYGCEHDRRRWVRMTQEEWDEQLNYLDIGQIKRALKNLVDKDNLLLSRTFEGRSKWYAINYEVLDSLNSPVDRLTQKSKKRRAAQEVAADKAKETEQDNGAMVQNEPIAVLAQSEPNSDFIGSKCTNTLVQNELTIGSKCTTSKNTSKNLLPNGNSDKSQQQDKTKKSPLSPETKSELLLFEIINKQRVAKNLRPAQRFQTLPQKEKCNSEFNRLGKSEFEKCLDYWITKGVIAGGDLVLRLGQWQPSRASPNAKNGNHQSVGGALSPQQQRQVELYGDM